MITHIVIHYSATPRGRHVTVSEIDQWHRARGFRKIGYHYVIYLDGSIHKGRDENEQGAHVKGQNRGKIGICWVGGTEPGSPNRGVDTRTPEQEQALIRLIRDLLERYPGARIVGHRDLAATQCPGFDVPAWWAKVNGNTFPERLVDPAAPVITSNNDGEDMTKQNTVVPIGTATGGGVLVGIAQGTSDVIWWVGLIVILASVVWALHKFGAWRWLGTKIKEKLIGSSRNR